MSGGISDWPVCAAEDCLQDALFERLYCPKHNTYLRESLAARPEPTKDTNPKDSAAVDRAPLALVPTVALVEESLAWFEGLLKYGAHNYTVAGIRTSVYVFGAGRHLLKYWCGQDRDPVTGVHHLASVRANCGALLDTAHRGKLTDDRPPALPRVDELFTHAATVMGGLLSLYGDRKPRHYTIDDSEPKR